MYRITNIISTRKEASALVGDASLFLWHNSGLRSHRLRPNGTRIGQFTGGGIDGPWGIAVDGEDNLWVANFGPLQQGSNFTDGRLAELCGINRAACPPGKKLGDPISPPTGYTVPSAGQQVLLHNGDPLYGLPPAPGGAQLRAIDASNECSDRPGWQHLGAQ